MTDLLLYLFFALIGVAIGIIAKRKNKNLDVAGKIQTVTITCLIFCMGLRMGSNEEIISKIGSIGIYAFVFTVITIALVIIFMYISRKLVGIDRFGNRNKHIDRSDKIGDSMQEKSSAINYMTIIILVSVAIGMLVGYFVIRNIFTSNYQEFNVAIGTAITVGLCILLLFVGIDIGMAGTIVDNFKKVGIRIFIFPIACIVGTMLAGLISSLFLPISAKEGLAIAGGFGWYTLAPGIIMEAGMITASAISFMHNVMRELFSFILIPIVAKKIGYVETIALPGAAAMDVCLPIVEKSTNSNVAVYSFISGAILSFLVPVLVPVIVAL